jgi:hypothetical protein
VAAVQCGRITLGEACRRYELSEEEFLSWRRAFETYGVDGLRVSGLQRYRGDRSSRLAKTVSAAAATATAQQETSAAVEGELQGSSVSSPQRAAKGVIA